MKKWFLRTVRCSLRTHLQLPVHVNVVGFQPGRSCREIVAIVSHLCHLARTWSDVSLIVGSLDVATAFDCMRHPLVGKALSRYGAKPTEVLAILQELAHCTTSLIVPSAGSTAEVSVTSGGPQWGRGHPRLLQRLYRLHIR